MWFLSMRSCKTQCLSLSALQFCERGTLGDAIADKRLLLPDGRPHMVGSVHAGKR